MELVVLGLGSNVPSVVDGALLQPKDLIRCACGRISSLLSDFTVSSLYDTKPMHYINQGDFVNAVVCGYYDKSPLELLKSIQAIETEFGRNRSNEIEKGPRTLDIDIELFGSYIIKTKNLTIPHEFLHTRAFVLVPLVEILPNSADPITRKKFSDILQSLSTRDVRKID